MSHSQRRSDGDLLVAARRDPEAFAAFYDRHVKAVLAFFRRRVGGVDVALDLTAETFAAALGALRGYTPSDVPARAWLFAIARHKLSDAIRRGQVDDLARRALAMEPVELDDEALELADRLASSPVLGLLEGLPQEQRVAITARHLEEREYTEIAADLRCSESVIRKRVSRGLAVLRSELEGRQPDD